jgi:hypothetical protein
MLRVCCEYVDYVEYVESMVRVCGEYVESMWRVCGVIWLYSTKVHLAITKDAETFSLNQSL